MSDIATAWAWQQKVGSPATKAVLVAIANYANESGYSDATQSLLAQMTELSERSVRRHIADLDGLGLIVREPSRFEDGTVGPDGIWLQTNQRTLWPVDQRTDCPTVTVAGGKKRTIPDDFGISPSIREWARKHGFEPYLDAHLDYFRDYCAANRKPYGDFEAAFRNSIRADWGGVRKNGKVAAPPQAPTCEFRGDPFDPARQPCGMADAVKGPYYGGRRLCQHHRRDFDERTSVAVPQDANQLLDKFRKRTAA